ncbi:MAG TPA: hypothetical protein VGM81_08540 [Burkholderiaceae bacterium]|jgi:hypothetical protein
MSNSNSSADKKAAITPRQWALGGALAATIAATLWAAQQGGDDDAAVQATAGKSRSTAPTASRSAPKPDAGPAAPTVVDWHTIQREDWAKPADAQLAAWMPPAPPPPPPAPPPPPPAPPMAPPFPYQLIGRLVDGNVEQALLAGPNRTLSVKVGEVVDNQWMVDQIGPTGLTVTWQPAKLKQMIAFKPTP